MSIKRTFQWTCPKCKGTVEAISTELTERHLIAHVAASHPEAEAETRAKALAGVYGAPVEDEDQDG